MLPLLPNNCALHCTLHSLSFEANGIVCIEETIDGELMAEPMVCRYLLGELQETADGYERPLHLTRLDPDSNGACQAFVGSLYLDPGNSTRRSITIPDLNLHVTDLRWLGEMRQDMPWWKRLKTWKEERQDAMLIHQALADMAMLTAVADYYEHPKENCEVKDKTFSLSGKSCKLPVRFQKALKGLPTEVFQGILFCRRVRL